MKSDTNNKAIFDINCRKCPRLSNFLDDVKQEHPNYHCRPVEPFGELSAQFLIVGLAPGKHGANASGRPFTGDHAGILLYETLHKFGFATHAQSLSADDDLQLINCRITNAVKCLPPENKPTTEETWTCNQFLINELNASHERLVMLALGQIAHKAILRTLDLKQSAYPFAHGKVHKLPESKRILIDTYHCSRYNTQTKRLTPSMFRAVFKKVTKYLD